MLEVGVHGQVTQLTRRDVIIDPIRWFEQVITLMVSFRFDEDCLFWGVPGVKSVNSFLLLQALPENIFEYRKGLGLREVGYFAWGVSGRWGAWWKTSFFCLLVWVIAGETAEACWLIHVDPITLSVSSTCGILSRSHLPNTVNVDAGFGAEELFELINPVSCRVGIVPIGKHCHSLKRNMVSTCLRILFLQRAFTGQTTPLNGFPLWSLTNIPSSMPFLYGR